MPRATNMLRVPWHEPGARSAPGRRSRWQRLRALWRALRTATGDDAYERYCAHQRQHHPCEPLMSRRAFCAEATGRKWGGVTRCC